MPYRYPGLNSPIIDDSTLVDECLLASYISLFTLIFSSFIGLRDRTWNLDVSWTILLILFSYSFLSRTTNTLALSAFLTMISG